MLETSAARQFERRLHVPDQPKLVLVLVDVERQRDGRHHLKVGGPRRAWLIDLLEVLLSRSDLAEIQRSMNSNIPFVRIDTTHVSHDQHLRRRTA